MPRTPTGSGNGAKEPSEGTDTLEAKVVDLARYRAAIARQPGKRRAEVILDQPDPGRLVRRKSSGSSQASVPTPRVPPRGAQQWRSRNCPLGVCASLAVRYCQVGASGPTSGLSRRNPPPPSSASGSST